MIEIVGCIGAAIIVLLIFLFVGYWMGRNSAGLAFNAIEKTKKIKPEDVPEEEDMFEKEMLKREEEPPEAVSTMEGEE
jgi:FtsZ-interacting cell division protein ZipA